MGVGTEVVPVGVKVLETTAEVRGGFRFQFQTFDWSCLTSDLGSSTHTDEVGAAIIAQLK